MRPRSGRSGRLAVQQRFVKKLVPRSFGISLAMVEGSSGIIAPRQLERDLRAARPAERGFRDPQQCRPNTVTSMLIQHHELVDPDSDRLPHGSQKHAENIHH